MLKRNDRAVVAALLAAACTGTASTPTAQVAQQGVAVEVAPGTAQVLPGGTVRFTAAVTGTADTAVAWTVDEQAGGSVDPAGLYTAPGAAGTFHVRATSHADAAAQGIATVTVTPAPVIGVAVTPRTPSVLTGGTIAFSATVTGTTNQGVTWRVQEASGCGIITAAGAYTAPALTGTCHVVATSMADTTKSDVATITVTAPPPVTVALSPPSATVDGCRTVQFTATVTGTTDTRVTWSVQEAASGTVSPAGLYTAPNGVGTAHVVATSVADPTKTAIALVTVNEHVLSVAVSPQNISVPAGGTAQFTATVTTTCGSFASVQTVSADGTVTAN
jgi:hypothetical protein